MHVSTRVAVLAHTRSWCGGEWRWVELPQAAWCPCVSVLVVACADGLGSAARLAYGVVTVETAGSKLWEDHGLPARGEGPSARALTCCRTQSTCHPSVDTPPRTGSWFWCVQTSGQCGPLERPRTASEAGWRRRSKCLVGGAPGGPGAPDGRFLPGDFLRGGRGHAPGKAMSRLRSAWPLPPLTSFPLLPRVLLLDSAPWGQSLVVLAAPSPRPEPLSGALGCTAAGPGPPCWRPQGTCGALSQPAGTICLFLCSFLGTCPPFPSPNRELGVLPLPVAHPEPVLGPVPAVSDSGFHCPWSATSETQAGLPVRCPSCRAPSQGLFHSLSTLSSPPPSH